MAEIVLSCIQILYTQIVSEKNYWGIEHASWFGGPARLSLLNTEIAIDNVFCIVDQHLFKRRTPKNKLGPRPVRLTPGRVGPAASET